MCHWRALCPLAYDNWRCSIQPEVFRSSKFCPSRDLISGRQQESLVYYYDCCESYGNLSDYCSACYLLSVSWLSHKTTMVQMYVDNHVNLYTTKTTQLTTIKGGEGVSRAEGGGEEWGVRGKRTRMPSGERGGGGESGGRQEDTGCPLVVHNRKTYNCQHNTAPPRHELPPPSAPPHPSSDS